MYLVMVKNPANWRVSLIGGYTHRLLAVIVAFNWRQLVGSFLLHSIGDVACNLVVEALKGGGHCRGGHPAFAAV